jgi:metal-dependent amidase/aminoacylase/carboxypeptidase family protein
VRNILEKAAQKTAETELLMGGEDFAHYLELHGGVSGSMWFLGAWQQDTGDHHAPTFNPDETVFWRGVLFWLLLACSE